MEIHETYFQEWHRLSITPVMFKSVSVPVLTPMVFVQIQGCGGLKSPLAPPCVHQASFGDDRGLELANRLDIILYINLGIE